jgi:hypothetical protein
VRPCHPTLRPRPSSPAHMYTPVHRLAQPSSWFSSQQPRQSHLLGVQISSSYSTAQCQNMSQCSPRKIWPHSPVAEPAVCPPTLSTTFHEISRGDWHVKSNLNRADSIPLTSGDHQSARQMMKLPARYFLGTPVLIHAFLSVGSDPGRSHHGYDGFGEEPRQR